MFELFMYVYSYCNVLSARFFAVEGTKLLFYDYDYD